MTIISIMLLIVGAALLLALMVLAACYASWSCFWRSWRDDDDDDWFAEG